QFENEGIHEVSGRPACFIRSFARFCLRKILRKEGGNTRGSIPRKLMEWVKPAVRCKAPADDKLCGTRRCETCAIDYLDRDIDWLDDRRADPIALGRRDVHLFVGLAQWRGRFCRALDRSKNCPLKTKIRMATCRYCRCWLSQIFCIFASNGRSSLRSSEKTVRERSSARNALDRKTAQRLMVATRYARCA